MEKVVKASKKFFTSYRTLPHKKQYLEFFTALLSIPVLLTVILLNLNSIRNLDKPEEKNSVQEKIFVTIPGTGERVEVTDEPCKEEIGPVEIDSPRERETVDDNPVVIDVSYDDDEYCAVVWSYRINGGRWSDYDDKSIALYNLPRGNVKLDLRVKSVVTRDEKTLTRNFTYNGDSNAFPVTPTTQVTPSN